MYVDYIDNIYHESQASKFFVTPCNMNLFVVLDKQTADVSFTTTCSIAL